MAIARKLTVGEQTYASSIFGVAIDYARVLVHNEKYIFFQPSDTAMTPNGEIYFPAPSYKADFSTSIPDAGWIIHELTHVWQYQHGVNVRVQGMLHRTYEYGDLSGKGSAFTSFYIEQQASIVEDYFYITHGYGAQKGSGSRADYARIIPFLPRAH
jgi:hypothetical protein